MSETCMYATMRVFLQMGGRRYQAGLAAPLNLGDGEHPSVEGPPLFEPRAASGAGLQSLFVAGLGMSDPVSV